VRQRRGRTFPAAGWQRLSSSTSKAVPRSPRCRAPTGSISASCSTCSTGRLGLVSETEIGELFDYCDVGAAPPIGSAYNVPTVLDRSLSGLDRVWFAGGDHRTLVSVAGADLPG
jgi:hypothetical protein